MKESQPFRYYLRVRYGECDQQGVVFNARYGEYVDLACTEFLHVALGRVEPFAGFFEMQVVKLLIEWTAPARNNDVLEISVMLKKLGTTSFTLGFEMRKPGESAAIVTAETVNVHVDAKTWKKAALSDDLRRQLSTGADGRIVDHAGHFTPQMT